MGPAALGRRRYTGPQCPKCSDPLPAGADARPFRSGRLRCSRCGLEFEAASFTPPVSHDGSPRFVPGGATCAVHELNAAADACARCGAFACELCRIATDGRILCAACFDRMASEGALPGIATREIDHASLAWTCFVACFPLWFLSLPLAAGGLVASLLGVYRARARREGENLVSLWLAALFNLAIIATWVVVLVVMLRPHA